jgi:ATP/maltotriose-dependent transcriptional regulator MalT
MVELLSTKLFIPRPRSKLVLRPRLIERLNDGLDRKLTLIAAPAGFGKTTLLSEWSQHSPRQVTWLSLNEGDQDPTLFWAYFIASLQTLHPELGNSALALLQSTQAPPIPTVLTTLINDLNAFPKTFCIVLEDYHLIDFQPIHEALTFLIAHLPANMHLVMTTRVDPPLPLARLRARDKLTELRANDLRFTADEAAAFLNQVMGLNLSAEEVSALERRTEGWIAGLQIAALSMQDREDTAGFIRAFSGSHRHILGYLAEEVLNQRPKGTMNFLLRTSILERLCGPLCDAVTGGSDGQAILENLEHANLFIASLDNEGIWYRYHHLFAEVLQARLRESHPETLADLHLRASEWYEAQNLFIEAVQHALSSGTVDRASQLIEQHRWALLGRGEAHTLHRWLDELPEKLLCNRPGLSLAYAWILSLLEQPEGIEARLLDAEQALATRPEQEFIENKNVIRGEIATLRAEIALSQSEIPRAVALCRQALELLPKENISMRGVATYFLGHGERRSGNMVEAEQAYLQASGIGLQTDNLLLALHALANLSTVQIAMGRLREATQSSQRILEITSERQRQTWPVAGLAYQGLGKVHYEWNDLDSAAYYLRQGIEYGQHGGLVGLEINSRTTLAFTLQAQNDASGADAMLREIAAINSQSHHPVYIAQAEALEARLRLRQNRIDHTIRWAESCGLSPDDTDWSYSRKVEYLTLARVLFTQGKQEGIDGMLERLMQTAEADKRTGDLIEILIQQALFLYTSNKKAQAFQPIERALLLAEPEGYIRTFVDEGKSMRLLLLDYQSILKKRMGDEDDGESFRLLKYIKKLLAEFSQDTPEEKSKPETMLEPLSERELEILHLIAMGLTNQEIAHRLVIAVSTVKSHINNMYTKFGTQRRTQAIAIARDLGLLSD